MGVSPIIKMRNISARKKKKLKKFEIIIRFNILLKVLKGRLPYFEITLCATSHSTLIQFYDQEAKLWKGTESNDMLSLDII